MNNKFRLLKKTAKFNPDDYKLGFVTDDYKETGYLIMWEFVEMVRKLLLSLVGVFFPEKGPVSIAVALLLSVFFWLLQENNQPFRSPTCNNLQRLCMGVLSLLYFFGLIITIDAPDAASKSRQVDSSCVVYATCFEFVIWL